MKLILDCSRYRQFLDSSGNALTIIACFTDVPPRGGGTALCEDGIKGESNDAIQLPCSSVLYD